VRFGAIDDETLALLHTATDRQLQQLGIVLLQEKTLALALSVAGLPLR